ncbi:TPA: hypothetical protein ACH3X2_009691 [Trebouxia sp. C0005]
MSASHRRPAHSHDYRRRQQAEKQESQVLMLPQIQNAKAAGYSSPLMRQMQRQQQQDMCWLAGLRQHHQEHQCGHDKAMCAVTGSQHTTGQMRQLAQAEVDWTSFRSAIEVYHAPDSDHQGHLANPADDTSPAIAKDFSSYSLPDCTSRSVAASECSPRSGYTLNSPRSPRVQPRPYTAPTIVSRQPLHLPTDSPCYVSSLYKGQQQAQLHLQYQIHANADDSMHSMIQESSFWSSPQPCSPVEPYLRSRPGGVASTYGSRERDRPQTGGDVTTAEPQASGLSISRSKVGNMINTMREHDQQTDSKPTSHIVTRSKAWPASRDRHPTGSGLTARQQVCLLGKTPLAKNEQKLAKKYGLWQEDLRSFSTCSAADAQKLGAQADWCIAAANDAMTPQIYTTGPV